MWPPEPVESSTEAWGQWTKRANAAAWARRISLGFDAAFERALRFGLRVRFIRAPISQSRHRLAFQSAGRGFFFVTHALFFSCCVVRRTTS